MKTQDKLFIFISVALVILFIVSVAENICASRDLRRAGLNLPYVNTENSENQTKTIMDSLEEAGLEPREAKYYE